VSASTHHLRRCRPSGKRRFRDKLEATKALHRATTSRHIAEMGETNSRRRECRAYWCDGCAGWHLTSHLDWKVWLPVTLLDGCDPELTAEARSSQGPPT
jgi:hypothetical protein